MTHDALLSFLPYFLITATIVVVLLVLTIGRNHARTALFSIGGLTIAFLSLAPALSYMPQEVTRLFLMDDYACFSLGLLILTTLAALVLSYGYLKTSPVLPDEFYLLMLLALLGACVLAAAIHFVSFFLGLELLSLSLYALIAYLPARERGVEAAVKYLVLAALSSALLLFGLALLYWESGTMEFGAVLERALQGAGNSPLFLGGTLLLVAGIGFKMALVPFHLWTPDVYEGAPAPVTAFIATLSKGAVFLFLYRTFQGASLPPGGSLFIIFSVIAAASMFVGNLLALFQNNVKRLLACSSIAHLGYLLVALLASGFLASTAAMFYLAAYIVTMMGAFGVVIYLSDGSKEAENRECYRSLAWRSPWLAGIFTLMLLSLAGMPLTAGFLGKFLLLAAGVQSALSALVLILVINSIIGLFYYLRLVLVMFTRPQAGAEGENRHAVSVPLPGRIVLTALLILLLWLGIYPEPFLELIQRMVSHG